MSQSNNKTRKIWLIALILALCVVVTVIVFIRRLDSFFLDDSGAISLITENHSEYDSNTNNPTHDTQQQQPSGTTDSRHENHPNFRTEDGQAVWTTNTSVEIFRMSYENGEHVVTVKSNHGDKIIAPGVDNSYTFKLKNTGDVALDYTMDMDIRFTSDEAEIPMEIRVRRYDGVWVFGREEEYIPVSLTKTTGDSATLGAGKYTYYTLDWMWPFESGNDDWDTMLGNIAVQEDVAVVVSIRTTAMESINPGDASGILPPKTGDNTGILIWILLLICTAVLLLVLGREQVYRGLRKIKNGIRFLLLVVCGLMLGMNLYLANANNIVGNQLPMPFGYGAAVVLSGSMEPTFSEGDLIIVKEEMDYGKNDVVVYQDGNSLVVHRIVDVDEEMVTTKGDANQVADAPISVAAIKGKVLGWIPIAGTIVKGIKTPIGTIVLVLVAIALVEIPNRRQREEDDVKRQELIEEIERLKKEV